jgi:central kinetochore subunit Mis15/CHL4
VLREVVGGANKNTSGEVHQVGELEKGKVERENEVSASGRGMKRPLETTEQITKRRRLLAEARFGPVPSAPLEQVDVRIEDPFPGEKETEWCPSIRVVFRGTDVFSGIRKLVERGVVDGERMPGWMTGEGGVSAGVVRGGRIGG